jgi:hypothetical protein
VCVLTVAKATAEMVTVAGVTFDTDNSVTAAVLSTEGVLSVAFVNWTVTGPLGTTDVGDHIGVLLGGGPMGQTVDITAGTPGTAGRNHITLTWASGEVVENLPGDDIHVFEEGAVFSPTQIFPEPYGVAVRQAGSPTFTGHRFQHVDAGDSAVNMIRTSFDISDFGLPGGALVGAIEIISLHNADATTPPFLEDRVDSASGQGNLTLDAGNSVGFGLLHGPLSAFSGQPIVIMDADITYVVAATTTVPVELSVFKVR